MPHSVDLHAASHQALIDSGFIADVPAAAQAELAKLTDSLGAVSPAAEDLRQLPWSSIDNDSSRDLDQLEVADKSSVGIRVRIAIADVDAFVPKGSEIDKFAAANSTSVYTGVATYPMLPERLSTDLTSL